MPVPEPAMPNVETLIGQLNDRLHAEYPKVLPEIIDCCVQDARPFVRRYTADATAYVEAVERVARAELDAMTLLRRPTS
jgi:hypothetical protein